MDIKTLLKEMREDDAVGADPCKAGAFREKKGKELEGFYRRRQEEDVLDLIDQIERGFDVLNTVLPIWIGSTANMCGPR